MINKNEVAATVKSFDDLKHVDENGREYWNAHELSKAMGYNDYRNFDQAINRAKNAMMSTGKNSEEHLVGSTESFISGNGAKREVKGYRLDKYGAYLTAMNADPSKTEVAYAQEYFLQSTATVEAIAKRMNDRETLGTRDNLRLANKKLNNTILSRDVEPEEIGIVLDQGDQGMFGKTTKELKEMAGIPNNRPVADFLGSDIAAYKNVAQINSRKEIEKHDLHGVKDIGEAVFDENRKMREMFIDKFDEAPENLLPGEDVKKVERRYNKQTKKYLDALEYEA